MLGKFLIWTKRGISVVLRFLVRRLSTVIALLSLFVAAASYLNTINVEQNDSKNRELSLRPWLGFQLSFEANEISVSIRNDGLGPAILENIVFQAKDQCIDSSDYVTYSSWDSAYRSQVAPWLQQTFVNDIFKELKKVAPKTAEQSNDSDYATDRQENISPKKATKEHSQTPQPDYTEYVAYDVAIKATFGDEEGLGPGKLVRSGSGVDIFKVKWTKAKRRLNSNESTLAEEFTDEENSALSSATDSAFHAFNAAIGYCSISGTTCDYMTTGGYRCDEFWDQ